MSIAAFLFPLGMLAALGLVEWFRHMRLHDGGQIDPFANCDLSNDYFDPGSITRYDAQLSGVIWVERFEYNDFPAMSDT